MRCTPVLLFLLALAPNFATAQQAGLQIPLWPNGASGFEGRRDKPEQYHAAHFPAEAHIFAQDSHAFNMDQRSTLVTLKGWPQRLADSYILELLRWFLIFERTKLIRMDLIDPS